MGQAARPAKNTPVKRQLTYSKVYLYMANVSVQVQNMKSNNYKDPFNIAFGAYIRKIVPAVTSNEIGSVGELNFYVSFYNLENTFNFIYTANNGIYRDINKPQLRLYPEGQEKKGIGYNVPDGYFTHGKSQNIIYVDVKNTQSINTTDWLKTAKRYTFLKEPVLFILQGDCANQNNIDAFNGKLAEAGYYEYAFALNMEKLPVVLKILSNQIEVDFRALKILLSH